jgi:hypothetical protein
MMSPPPPGDLGRPRDPNSRWVDFGCGNAIFWDWSQTNEVIILDDDDEGDDDVDVEDSEEGQGKQVVEVEDSDDEVVALEVVEV